MNSNAKQQRRIAAAAQLERKIKRAGGAQKPRSKRRRTRRNPNRIRSTTGKGFLNNAYAICRLRPFNTRGSAVGIPDGANGRRLLMDHRLSQTLTFGPTGTFNMIVWPALPCPIIVQMSDVGFQINGQTFPNNNPNPALYIPLCISEWNGVPLNWYATAGRLNDAGSIFESTRFRVVTMGYRISYLGTTLNDSGLIKISSAAINFEAPDINPTALTIYSSQSAVNTAVGLNEMWETVVNAPFLQQNLASFASNDTVFMPLRQGIEGANRHLAADYEYCNIHRTGNAIVGSQNNGFGLLTNTVPSQPAVNGSCHLGGYDNGWEAHVVSVSGGTSGQSFMIDLVMCVEYVPQPTSAAYALARSGPNENKPLMQKVENELKEKPLAARIKDNVEGIGNLIGMVKAAGSLIPLVL